MPDAPAAPAAASLRSLPAGFLQGALGQVALRVAQAGTGLAVTALLARALGPAGLGTYAHALAVLTLAAMAARLGLPNLLVREVAAGQARRRWGAVHGLLRRAGQWGALGSVALLAGIAAGVWLVGPAPVYRNALLLGLPLVPLLALGDLRGAALRGLRHVVLGQLPEHLLRPGLLLLVLIAATLAGVGLSPAAAMAAHVAAAAVAFVIGAWLLQRRLPLAVRHAAPVDDPRRWLASALPLAFIAGMQAILLHADVVMLGWLAGVEDAGVYRVAAQASLLVAFGLEAAKIAAAPHLARLSAGGEGAALRHAFRAASLLALMPGLGAAAILALAGRPVLELAFGVGFAGAYGPLVILCLGQLARTLGGVAGELLNMAGREASTARAVGIAAASNIALNAILIPPFGATGAAVATAASLAVWTFAMLHSARACLHAGNRAPAEARGDG